MANTYPANIYPALTVAVTTTAQKLYTLLQAADSTIAPRGREITLQSDPSNAANIRIGQSNVSTSFCGYVLTPGSSRTYRASENNCAPLADMYVLTDTGTSKLNVEIVTR